MNNSPSSHKPEQPPNLPEEETLALLLRMAGPRPPVPPERQQRVRLAAHSSWQQCLREGRRRRLPIWIASALAAAAALVIAVGLGLRREASSSGMQGETKVEVVRGSVRTLRSGDVKPGDVIRVGDELLTASDSRAALRLPGGASLRLDTESRAQLLSDSAIALHQGAAYIDTGSPSAGSPLEIRTPLGLVTEIGTQFEVRLDNGSLGLRVRDGLVSLKSGGRAYRAEAGQQIVAGSEGRVVTSEVPRHGEEWSWTLGIAPSFELEGRSLEEFLLWVTDETGWRVEYEESSIAEHAPELLLHGSVEGLRPDEAPGVVLPTCGLRHRVADGILIVGRIQPFRF